VSSYGRARYEKEYLNGGFSRPQRRAPSEPPPDRADPPLSLNLLTRVVLTVSPLQPPLGAPKARGRRRPPEFRPAGAPVAPLTNSEGRAIPGRPSLTPAFPPPSSPAGDEQTCFPASPRAIQLRHRKGGPVLFWDQWTGAPKLRILCLACQTTPAHTLAPSVPTPFLRRNGFRDRLVSGKSPGTGGPRRIPAPQPFPPRPPGNTFQVFLFLRSPFFFCLNKN